MRKLTEAEIAEHVLRDFPTGQRYKDSTLTPTGVFKTATGNFKPYTAIEVVCTHFGVGTPTTKFVRATAFKAGKIKSCGCLLSNIVAERSRKVHEVPLIEALKASFTYCHNTGNFYKILFDGSISDQPAGCMQSKRYLGIRFRNKLWLNHRLAWLYNYGVEPLNHIDHIDGNGMNNKIENLRECSPIENGQNRRALNKNNTSGYAGVWKHKRGWAAEVMFEYTKYDLGVYPTIEAANKAREDAKQRLHTFNPTAPTSK